MGAATQASDVQRGWHVGPEPGPSQAPGYLLKESLRSEAKKMGHPLTGLSAPSASPARTLNDQGLIIR